jgi:hypothetical protein
MTPTLPAPEPALSSRWNDPLADELLPLGVFLLTLLTSVGVWG